MSDDTEKILSTSPTKHNCEITILIFQKKNYIVEIKWEKPKVQKDKGIMNKLKEDQKEV